MSATSMVVEDDSRLSWLDRFLFKLETYLTLAGGITIFALMILSVVQILGRKFFNMPVPGFIDWVEQAMAVFAFLGIAYCQRLGGHIRMDIMIGALKGRPLWTAEFFSTTVMLILSGLLTYGSFLHFERAWSLGDSSIDIGLPLWPAKLMAPLALGFLTLRLALQLWGYMRAIRLGGDRPVAVPLIESAAEQAAHEAESLSEAADEVERAK